PLSDPFSSPLLSLNAVFCNCSFFPCLEIITNLVFGILEHVPIGPVCVCDIAIVRDIELSAFPRHRSHTRWFFSLCTRTSSFDTAGRPITRKEAETTQQETTLESGHPKLPGHASW